MSARAGRLPLASAALLAAAVALGVLSAVQPVIALAAAAAGMIAYLIVSDLAIGFAILMFLSFLAVLPTSGSLSPAKGAGLLLALAWIARFTSTREGARDFFADHPLLSWAMLALLGWTALTLVWAPHTGPALTDISQYFLTLLLIPIAYTAVCGKRDLKVALAAIVLGAILAALVGIVQPPDAEVVENARATGTIGDPNEFAADLLVGLSLGAGFAVARGSRTSLRLLGLAAVPLCGLGIFLSVSRGGLVAMSVVFIVAVFAAGRWRFAATTTLLIVAVGGVVYFTAFAPLPARERVLTTNGGTGRTELWHVGLRIVKTHPAGGIGAGNYVSVSPQYALAPGLITHGDLIFTKEPKPAHNTYLQVAAELGLPGLLLFLTVIFGCVACALRAARIAARRSDVTLEALSRAVFLGTVGLLAAFFFISQMHSKILWGLLALAPALLSVARQEEARDENGADGYGRAPLFVGGSPGA
jgi:O-antigen ligase